MSLPPPPGVLFAEKHRLVVVARILQEVTVLHRTAVTIGICALLSAGLTAGFPIRTPARPIGFGGCNRFSASYRLSGDSLSFGPVVSTKMACTDGDELERSFLATLPKVATYQVTDSALTLNDPGGVLARFRARQSAP
jgi:hypothetical protein